MEPAGDNEPMVIGDSQTGTSDFTAGSKKSALGNLSDDKSMRRLFDFDDIDQSLSGDAYGHKSHLRLSFHAANRAFGHVDG